MIKREDYENYQRMLKNAPKTALTRKKPAPWIPTVALENKKKKKRALTSQLNLNSLPY